MFPLFTRSEEISNLINKKNVYEYTQIIKLVVCLCMSVKKKISQHTSFKIE